MFKRRRTASATLRLFPLRVDVSLLHQQSLTRREALLGMTGAAALLAACRSDDVTGTGAWSTGRIRARPSSPTLVPPTGVTPIPVTVGVDGLLFVPSTYK